MFLHHNRLYSVKKGKKKICMLKEKFRFDEVIGFCLFGLSIILLIIMLLLGLNQAIWWDDAYSIISISESFKNMIINTAVDVHPPLYYIILKYICQFFNMFNSSEEFTILVGKLTSAIPMFLLLCFSFVCLKKNLGWLVCGIFALCIVTMPNMMHFAVEIRMYSWVMFFLTISFYYSYNIIKDNNKKNWIIFTIFSLLSSYTHYYGLIATGFIYLFLLAHILFKNRSLLKKWIISLIVSVLAYVPWVYIFITNSEYFTSDQWAIPSFDYLIEVIKFIFSTPIHYIEADNYQFDQTGLGLGILLFILFISLYILHTYRSYKEDEHSKHEHSKQFLVYGGVLILIATICFAYLFTVSIKPMIYVKYVFPMLGCLWLSFSVLLSNFYSKNKIIFTIGLTILLLNASISCINFATFESGEKNAYYDFKNVANQINDNDSIIYLGGSGSAFFRPIYFKDKKKNETFFYYENSSYFENKSLLYSNINEYLTKGNVYVIQSLREDINITTFNNSMVDIGFSLKEIVKIRKSHAYPHSIYLVEHH
ncbi:MAG: glycosyltransferase family 39 protein [Methanobrevibacter sp.]|nr:glycosyltransferase family 39 protein [Candidatus Methanovirga meridionalis]